MRLVKFQVVLALLTTLILFSLTTAQEEKAMFFEVKTPIANVYKSLDPKSEIVKQVMIGERLELIAQGTSWHNVRVDSKNGWIENQTGKIVKGEKGFPVFSFIFLLVLIAGTGIIVYTRINKTQSTETEEV